MHSGALNYYATWELFGSRSYGPCLAIRPWKKIKKHRQLTLDAFENILKTAALFKTDELGLLCTELSG